MKEKKTEKKVNIEKPEVEETKKVETKVVNKPKAERAIVISNSLFIKEKPKDDSQTIAVVDKLTHLQVLETAADFTKVNVINNNAIPTGYVLSKNIEYER